MVDVRYDWKTGWEGSDLPSVGYADPLGTIRMFSNPQSDKVDDWLFWTAFQLQGLNMFTGWLSGQSYRTMSGIAFEAFTGHRFKTVAGRALARAGPVAVPFVIALAAHQTVMNPDSDYYVPPDAPIVGRWQYGSEDVGSRLITALTDDLVDLLS